jgi:tetratricopeptide (TPR) repeat protein
MTASILKQALALHRAGRMAEAEAAYRRVLTAEPGNPDALHLLGLACHQSGRHAEALQLIERAIGTQSKPTYWYNIGHVHLAMRNASRAEDAFCHAVALAPRHAEALFHLGELQARRDDLSGALDCYRRAIDANPEFVDARVNLALLLNKRGDAAEAIGHLEEALRLRPEDAEIHNNIGIVRRGTVPLQAIDDFRRALTLNRDHTDAKINLAKLLCSMRRHGDAIELLASAIEHKPGDADLRMLLASALAEMNRLEEAVHHFEAAAAALPQSARPLVALGNLYRRFGRFDDAYRCHLQARELDPRNCDALVGILKHLKARVSREELEGAARLAEYPALAPSQRRQLHFAVSASKEAMGDYDAAFLHMERGNELRRMELELQSGPYDFAKQAARIDRIIEAFNRDYFLRIAGYGSDSEIPVFVVGMPRSGTTLCEQILASHSKAFGADEHPDMSRIERELRDGYERQNGGGTDTDYAAHLTPDLVRWAAEGYLTRLQRLAPEASRIVDKMLMNYYRLGLIATLFPKSKIIHCRRDPMDTGLSCYSKDFAGLPAWVTDLDSIGRVYRQHERLMAHWRQVLPIEILELRYEDVVADVEASARRLIRHCNLAWEEACLEFHRTNRQVKTASLEQVRHPIYDTSIGRWRKFERHLAPLREALAET